MKATKILLTFLIFYFSISIINAQNLVPNPSFEEYYQCPDTNAMIQYASNWLPDGGTVDYFNPCATFDWFSVPNNFAGVQIPHKGYSYAGFCTFTSEGTNYREFFTCKLQDSLQIGNKYFISFYVSLSDYSNCKSNNIGLKFKTFCNYWTTPDNFSHFKIDTMILDTIDWVKITGSFIADSSYTYVEFGNFYDDNNTDTIIISPPSTFFDLSSGYASYYYIDDICISEDSLFCNTQTTINNFAKQDKISIYPNPVNKIVNVNCQNNISIIEIINLYGKKIKTITNILSNNYTLDISNLENGIYILKITNNKSNSFNKKFVKF